jgi:hypothetical protein
LAADGFTYEREAIAKWFETSDRSPMTNEVLTDFELKSNLAIKSIIKSLADPKGTQIVSVVHDSTSSESQS